MTRPSLRPRPSALMNAKDGIQTIPQRSVSRRRTGKICSSRPLIPILTAIASLISRCQIRSDTDENDSDAFALVPNNNDPSGYTPTQYLVYIGEALTWGCNEEFNITVTATDRHDPDESATLDLTITLNDVIGSKLDDQTFTLNENDPNVGMVAVTDSPESVTFAFVTYAFAGWVRQAMRIARLKATLIRKSISTLIRSQARSRRTRPIG